MKQIEFDMSLAQPIPDYDSLKPILYLTESIPSKVLAGLDVEDGSFVIDTETTSKRYPGTTTYNKETKKDEYKPSLGGLCYWVADIRLIQIRNLDGGNILIFDLFKLPEEDIDKLKAVLRKMLKAPKVKTIGHNYLFDLTMLAYWLDTTDIENTSCTMVMSMQLHNGVRVTSDRAIPHNLKACLRRELNQTIDKTEQSSDWGAEYLTLEQLEYAADDVANTAELFKVLRSRIQENNLQKVTAVACEVLPVFASMHITGTPLDIEKTKAAHAYHDDLRNKQIAIFHEQFPGCKLSGDDLGKAIDARLKADEYPRYAELEEIWADRRKKNPKAGKSFDASILSILSDAYPGLAALSETRTLDKHIKYLEAMIANYNHVGKYHRNGYGNVYTKYRSMTATSIGRSTSSAVAKVTSKSAFKTGELGINLQQAAKPYDGNKEMSIRACFPMSVISDLAAAHRV